MPLLGADARHGAADDIGRPSSASKLTANAPGSSGGINIASLNRSVGGGGGGGGGGGSGGGESVAAAVAEPVAAEADWRGRAAQQA